jgi:hypothetical protein
MAALGHAGAAPRASAGVPVAAENWPALRVFVAMGTQWRRAGLGGIETGLDYAALPAVCGALAVPLDEDLLWRVRMLEAEALAVMAERRA